MGVAMDELTHYLIFEAPRKLRTKRYRFLREKQSVRSARHPKHQAVLSVFEDVWDALRTSDIVEPYFRCYFGLLESVISSFLDVLLNHEPAKMNDAMGKLFRYWSGKRIEIFLWAWWQ